MSLQSGINQIKLDLENAIKNGGAKGKRSLICSRKLINLLHEGIKEELISHGLNRSNLYPPIGSSKPELKIAGYLKQKDQDISITPSNLLKEERQINWGPLQFENKVDPLGHNFSEQTLVINVRSQLSSLNKNTDTLFERTFAEAHNLHLLYPRMVLGEVYMIPIFEYDKDAIKEKEIQFLQKRTNVEKYISFFSAISGRSDNDEGHKYERCALLIVDFRENPCKIYNSTSELKADGLVNEDFNVELANISIESFITDLKNIYSERFEISNIME